MTNLSKSTSSKAQMNTFFTGIEAINVTCSDTTLPYIVITAVEP